MSEPHVFVVALPRGLELVTANDRHHFMKKARIVAGIRNAAGWQAKVCRIPGLDRARIDAVYCPPSNRVRDAANLHPAVKAAIDGIVTDAGVLPGDDDRYVVGPFVTIGVIDVIAKAEGRRWGSLVLTITELPGEDPS